MFPINTYPCRDPRVLPTRYQSIFICFLLKLQVMCVIFWHQEDKSLAYSPPWRVSVRSGGKLCCHSRYMCAHLKVGLRPLRTAGWRQSEHLECAIAARWPCASVSIHSGRLLQEGGGCHSPVHTTLPHVASVPPPLSPSKPPHQIEYQASGSREIAGYQVKMGDKT